MELNDISQVAQTIYFGHQNSINATSGQTLSIETSPSGSEILNAEVPAGKNWDIEIWLQIVENDN